MTCPYCKASNLEEDHRCQRCGRPLRADYSGYSVRSAAYAKQATARAFDPRQDSGEEAEAQPGRVEIEPGKHPRTPIQSALFPTRVISFKDRAPEAIQPAPKYSAASAGRRPKPAVAGQESFEFNAGLPQVSPAYSQFEDSPIACDAPVATPMHRVLAAAFDIGLVAVASLLFLLPLYFVLSHFGGGGPGYTRHAALMLAAVPAAFFLMYEILWCLAGTDTAGMRWAHLKLVNFEGQPPERGQRLIRLASSALSLFAAGLGLLWAFVDEEWLTWHDQISKTFPTPY